MHPGLSALLEFYHAHQADEALVLGTVIADIHAFLNQHDGAMLIRKNL